MEIPFKEKGVRGPMGKMGTRFLAEPVVTEQGVIVWN